MASFKVEGYQVGQIMTNCYLMRNEDKKELLIIDPGDQADLIAKKVEASGCKPVAILLTHGHFDHVLAVNDLREKYGIPVYAHEKEKKQLHDTAAEFFPRLGRSGEIAVDEFMSGEPSLELAGFRIKVYSTPGHTPGGVCYYFEKEGILFSGDTLFCGSIGRTDFPGGSYKDLIASVEKKLFPLPEDVVVYPGHNNATSIGFEKQYNPFF
jgi:hydroxyacylglutathione hydrolase